MILGPMCQAGCMGGGISVSEEIFEVGAGAQEHASLSLSHLGGQAMRALTSLLGALLPFFLSSFFQPLK